MKSFDNRHTQGRLSYFVSEVLRPHSKDRDRAFREHVIRMSLAIAIVGTFLSLFSSLFIYQSQGTLLSFPSLHVVVLTLLLAAGFAVNRGHLLISGWLLVIAILAGASGIVLLARQNDLIGTIFIGFGPYMVVPLIAVSVLPRSTILPVSITCAILYGIAQFGVQLGAEQVDVVPVQQIISISFLLLIEGVLLRQLRAEFDARLDAMSNLIRETEQAKQQAELDRQRAEEADRTKSQFLASMSHELRTPLNAIIGYDEAMLAGMVGPISEKQSDVLRNIQNNGRRLLGLINDVLDLAKIESGRLELYFGPMSPRKVISETVESLQSLALQKKISLVLNFDDGLPEVVLGDAKKIEQVLVNLLSNAIKFTEQGEIIVEAGLLSEDLWQLRVRDSGIGMTPEALSLIFEPFRQVDDSLTRRHRGTGLGLSITKHLVEMMGGAIQVESELGNGSLFTVALPVRKDN